MPAGFPAERFERRLSLAALRVPCQDIAKVNKHPALKDVLFKRRGVKNVVEDPGGDAGRRLVLLCEAVRPGCLERTLPAEAWAAVQGMLDSGRAQSATHDVVVSYEHLSAEEALACVLPDGVEVPTSFETVGQIAHFNLRAAHEPFKEFIGRVVLDKNRSLRTVVNKVGELSNEFRTFKMEVLAGEPSFLTSVKEQGMSFDLDYSEVYWNSRLSQERQRVLQQLSSGQIVLDMFAGIGAMSCFAASAGCRVYCNDLNPQGAHWQRHNVRRNQLEPWVEVHNLDAREFVRNVASAAGLFSSARTTAVHAIMNLPELALDFMDVFSGICPEDQTPGPTHIHCYCFARKDPPHEEICPRVEAALGALPPGIKVVNVRDVAPNKIMYCVEFEVPLDTLRGPPSKRRKVAD